MAKYSDTVKVTCSRFVSELPIADGSLLQMSLGRRREVYRLGGDYFLRDDSLVFPTNGARQTLILTLGRTDNRSSNEDARLP